MTSFSGLPSPTNRWQRALYLPLTVLAWLAVVILIGWLLGHVMHTIVMIVLAAILAFALAPLVTLLRHFISRPFAIGLAYFVGVAIVVGLGTLLVVTAAQQVINLVANMPAYTQQVRQIEPSLAGVLSPFGVTGANLQALNQQLLGELQRLGGIVASGSLGIARSVAGDILDVVLILMLSIYFTLSGPRVVAWLTRSTPANVRPLSHFLIDTVNQVVGGYIRGTLTMASLIGLLVGLGLWVLGVPYAVLLGVLAFFMEFVPVVGVLISGAVTLIVTLPRGLSSVLVVLAYFVFVHVIESDVVGPRIMGRAVGIHPATGIIALLAGTELFGLWGALFASPIAGLLQAVITVVWRGFTDGVPGILAEVSQKHEEIERDKHDELPVPEESPS